MRQAALNKELQSTLIFLTIAVSVLGLAAFWIFSAAGEAAKYQTGLRAVQSERAQILKYQLDEETGLRGYAGTGNRSLLQPYNEARPVLPGAFANFERDLAALGLPALRSVAVDERHLNERWLSTIARPMRANWRSASLALERRGKDMVDRFRRDDFTLRRGIEAAAVSTDARAQRVLLYVLCLMVAGLLVITVIAVALLRVRVERGSQILFNIVVESAPSAMLVVNEYGRIVLINGQTERLFGYARSEVVGQSIELLVPEAFRGGHLEGNRPLSSTLIARATAAGRDLHGRRKDGRDVPIEIGLTPVVSAGKALTLAVVTDITERKATQERLTLLVEASPTAMLLVDGGGRITLVNAETERLFGYARSELVGRSIELLVPQRVRGEHPGLRTSFYEAPLAREMGAGRDLRGQRKDGSEVAVEIGLNPITSMGQTFTLAAVTDISERKAVEELRRFKAESELSSAKREGDREREWSTAFQRAVLPASLPRVAGLSFDAMYEPGLHHAKVGGDWYDVIRLNDGRVIISIGDVCGSGLRAAVVVGVVRQVMRGVAQLHANPSVILDATDRALCLEYPNVFVSAWVGLIDLVTRTITYSSAGHPAPLVVSREGDLRELHDPTTVLIGLREGQRAQLNRIEIMPGDTLVLFTDGVIEATHDILAGLQSLRAAAIELALAPNPSPAPAAAIRQHVIPEGSSDDAAILVVRTDCAQAERHIQRWRFDLSDRIEASAVRGLVVESLRLHNFTTDECANAELIFWELIGNVVRHARRTRRVDVVLDHCGPPSVLHVMDRGPGFQHVSRLPRDPYAESGRGLFMVGALGVDFTVSDRPEGGSHARVVLRGGSRTGQTVPSRLRMKAVV